MECHCPKSILPLFCATTPTFWLNPLYFQYSHLLHLFGIPRFHLGSGDPQFLPLNIPVLRNEGAHVNWLASHVTICKDIGFTDCFQNDGGNGYPPGLSSYRLCQKEIWFMEGEDSGVDPGTFSSWLKGQVVMEGLVGEKSHLGASSSQTKGTLGWRGVGFDSGTPSTWTRAPES